jgi:hypothetical protein
MYIQTNEHLIFRDSPEHIDFHIQSGDYFAFLATMMGFMEEALERCEAAQLTEQECKLARGLRHDLRYIQANHEIRPRDLGDIQIIRGSGNLLTKEQIT